MRSALRNVPLLLALASCQSPPKPPTVDESQKRPVNSAMAIELQVCKIELHNTRLVADETVRQAEAASATTARLAAIERVAAARPVMPAEQGNIVYSVTFAFGSSQLERPQLLPADLIEQARHAPLVLLRGRTDGRNDNLVDSRIARARAEAVRTALVQAGVDPTRVRATYQAVGDNAATNESIGGRQLNRRVEIELYRALPRVFSNEPTPVS